MTVSAAGLQPPPAGPIASVLDLCVSTVLGHIDQVILGLHEYARRARAHCPTMTSWTTFWRVLRRLGGRFHRDIARPKKRTILRRSYALTSSTAPHFYAAD